MMIRTLASALHSPKTVTFNNSFGTSQKRSHLGNSNSSRLTHYEVLGISRMASTKEIKEAYVKLSMEVHPDRLMGGGDSAGDSRFVALNEAYTVLSRPGEKRIYDLGLHGQENKSVRSNEDDSPPSHARPMSFEERAQFMGYPKMDPNYYKKNNRHYQIAAGCVVFIVFGFVVHFSIARMVYEKHARELSRENKRLNDYAEIARENALRFSSVQEQWKDFEKRRVDELEQRKKRGT